MSRSRRRRLLAALLQLPGEDKRSLTGCMRGLAPSLRIIPGPPPTPVAVYARIWYQQTGIRQWIVAPGLTDL